MSKLVTVGAAVSFGLIFPFATAAFELEDGTFIFGQETPVPAAVMAIEDCGADEDTFAIPLPAAFCSPFSVPATIRISCKP